MDDVCLLWAPLITVVVSAAKRVPLVRKYPKLWALALSIALAAWRARHPNIATPELRELLVCVTAQFAVAVATFETIVKPAKKLDARRRVDGPPRGDSST